MSSEFEVEVVFDDYGFDIGKAELFGEINQFIFGERVEITGGTTMKGDREIFSAAVAVEFGLVQAPDGNEGGAV